MKLLIPVLSLVAFSGVALAQTTPVAAPATPSIPTTPFFNDVPPNHWAFAAVQRLAAAGIIEGYGNTAAPRTQVVAEVTPAHSHAAKAPAKTVAKVVIKKAPSAVQSKTVR